MLLERGDLWKEVRLQLPWTRMIFLSVREMLLHLESCDAGVTQVEFLATNQIIQRLRSPEEQFQI